MKKHTPGPWTVHTHNQVIASKRSVLDVPICRLIADEREGQDPKANLALIAAAPELLEMLEETTRFLNACQDYENILAERAHTDVVSQKHLSRAEEYRKHLTACMKLLAKARGYDEHQEASTEAS